jgi:hypothetical protein
MSALGVKLTLMIGPTVAVPAPPSLIEALDRVEVTHSDEGRSGFQLSFGVGRSGTSDLYDYSLLSGPLVKPFNRVILIVTFNATPHVLMDGIITHQQLAPSNEPGGSALTVTGEDVSVMMDLEEKTAEHPAQDETIIANKIIATYAQYGLVPTVTPPSVLDAPIPTERVPVQQGTDLQYLQEMAARHAYVFYVQPGPVPFMNTAYWGPPQRMGLPQRALSVNMGSESNVESLHFSQNALSPALVQGKVQDRTSNQSTPVETFLSTLVPLASMSAVLVNQPNVRKVQMRQSGLTSAQAMGRAQAITDQSSADTVTASGEMNAVTYGGLLQARGLVGVRGAGNSYDGFYYVKRVTHTISIPQSEYRQSFTLTREGSGSTTGMVVP